MPPFNGPPRVIADEEKLIWSLALLIQPSIKKMRQNKTASAYGCIAVRLL